MNTHDEELASLYVLDRLDRVERVDFEARLVHDAALLARVRELETKLAQHVRALPPQPAPADLLQRIEQRIDRVDRGTRAAPARRISPVLPWVARWGIAAVIALSLTVLAFKRRAPDPSVSAPSLFVVRLNSQKSTFTELPLQNRPRDSDAAFIQLASLAERFWEAPQSVPAKLNSPHDNGRAYALFDPTSHQGFIGIEQLPAAEAGKRYHLWVLDGASGQVRDAGVLPLEQSTRGLYFFALPAQTESTASRVDIFVTAEDAATPGVPRPRGKVVLGQTRI